jgi:hypothetical protein
MSRFEEIREKLQTTKVFVAAGSAAALGIFAVAVRASHPATHSSTPAGSGVPVQQAQSDESSSGFDFGYGSIGPSSGASPSTGSGAS